MRLVPSCSQLISAGFLVSFRRPLLVSRKHTPLAHVLSCRLLVGHLQFLVVAAVLLVLFVVVDLPTRPPLRSLCGVVLHVVLGVKERKLKLGASTGACISTSALLIFCCSNSAFGSSSCASSSSVDAEPSCKLSALACAVASPPGGPYFVSRCAARSAPLLEPFPLDAAASLRQVFAMAEPAIATRLAAVEAEAALIRVCPQHSLHLGDRLLSQHGCVPHVKLGAPHG